MARNTADACMFCDHNPCTCTKVKRAKLGPAPTPHRAAGSASEVGPAAENPVSAPPVASEGPTRVRPNLASVARVRDEEKDTETEALAYAVTLFAERDMLHRDSLTEHRDLVRLPAYKIDAMIWRQDNVAARGG